MFPDLKSRPFFEGLIPLAFDVAVFSEVEQICCDIPNIDFSDNVMSLSNLP